MKADVGIITILPEEFSALRGHFQSEARQIPDDPFIFYEGTFETSNLPYSIVLARVGTAGTHDAELYATELIQRYFPEAILLVGIAAGVQAEDIKLGDVIVADSSHYYESGKQRGEEFEARSRVFNTDPLLRKRAEALLDSGWQARTKTTSPDPKLNPTAIVGKIACGEKVQASNTGVAELRSLIPKLAAIAMEGTGVAMSCEYGRVRFIEIRGVSDFADELKDDRYHKFAADVAAAFAAELLYNYPLSASAANTIVPDPSDLSRNMLGEQDDYGIRIERESLVEEVVSFCQNGSGMIVGVPGIGKSHLLRRAYRALKDEEAKVFYLAVDRIALNEEQGLEAALGINDSFVDYLRSISNDGSAPGILIVDGFDAARNQIAQDRWLALVSSVRLALSDTWNVVVGVRTYDALKSQRLRILFPNNGTQTFDGLNCRHILVPKLTDVEIDEALGAIPTFAANFENASTSVKDLCQIPFYLKLLADLSETALGQLSQIHTEVELLDLFWKNRIEENEHAVLLSLALTALTKQLVLNKLLALNIDTVIERIAIEQWELLLSHDIVRLTGPAKSSIGFSHNIFFDYAVSVYEITTDSTFEDYCFRDDGSSLFLRPSLLYYGTRLWHQRRREFWSLYANLAAKDQNTLRASVKTIYPAVIVRETDDPKGLADEVFSQPSLFPNGVGLILQVLQAEPEIPEDGWGSFLLACARSPHNVFIPYLLTLAIALAEKANEPETLSILADVGSNLFDWLWRSWASNPNAVIEHQLSRGAIKIIASTFGQNPEAACERILKVIEKVGTPGFPIDFLYIIVSSIQPIWAVDSDLARIIYSKVFGYSEPSDERVSMGGPVLNLVTNRRQEYSGCKWALAESFEKIVASGDISTIEVGISAVNAYVIESHVQPYLRDGFRLEDLPRGFTFRGVEAFYIEDGSSIWDQDSHIEDGQRIAKSLFIAISKQEGDSTFREMALDSIARFGHVGVLWRSLLILGEQQPDTFGKDIWELAMVRPIQLGLDTHLPLIRYLTRCFALLEEHQRLSIQHSLLELLSAEDDRYTPDLISRRVPELIGAIPGDLLTLVELRAIMAANSNLELPTEEPVPFESYSGPYTEEHWLSDEGVDVEDAEVQRLLTESAPLEPFERQWMNAVPQPEDRSAILAPLASVWSEVEMLVAQDAMEGSMVTKCTAVAAKLAEMDDVVNHSSYELLRRILIVSSAHRLPIPHPENDTSNFPTWSSSPRLEAARGISCLLSKVTDPTLYHIYVGLLSDLDGSVRIHALWGLARVLQNPDYHSGIPGLVLSLATSERYPAAKAVISDFVGALLRGETYEGALQILRAIVDNELSGTHQREERMSKSSINLIVWLSIAKQNPWAIAMVERMIQDESLNKELRTATFMLFRYVSIVTLASNENIAGIERCIDWIIRIVEMMNSRMSQFLTSGSADSNYAQRVFPVIDEVATRLYFNSGAYESSAEHTLAEVHPEIQRQFYSLIRPILELLVCLPGSEDEKKLILAQTAHHLMGTLNSLLPHDVGDVLNLMSNLVRMSKPSGYPFDSLAMSELTKLVDTLLADHRVMIREGQPLTDLLDILDCFEQSGNPEVQRFVWRLEEVFR